MINNYAEIAITRQEKKMAYAFAHGQVYVALSRCTSFSGLRLKRPIAASDVIFDELDLIRVLNLSTLPVKVVAEGQWSWALRLGVDRLKENEGNRYDGIVSFGVGRAKQWNETITSYGLVDFAAHTLDPYVRLRPHFGLKFDFGKTQAWGYFGAETVNYRAGLRGVWGGKLQYQWNERYSLRAEFSSENATRVSVGINRYF